jgi:uncharacterized membrane protein YsdA (DUF1294 family)
MELFGQPLWLLLIGLLITLNVVACIVMGRDKRRAIHGRNAERAAEGFLFFLAAMGGAIGIYLGMLLFRHKTRRWYFQIGIPVLITQQIVLAYGALIWAGIGLL